MKNLKKVFINLLLSCFVISLVLVLGEFMIRIFFDPVDYLRPELIKDEILGHTIKENSAYHDAWGFRNKHVPESAEIVAIGDSQTYGVSAIAKHSWPAILQAISNKSVYNMSLGGYCPVQYYWLLKEKAFKLKPSLVIVGFYFGNDLMEAYKNVYKNSSYWQHFQNNDFDYKTNINSDDFNPTEVHKTLANKIRIWLGRHCVSYKMAGFLVGNTFYEIERKIHTRTKSDCSIIEYRKNNIYTAFTPQRRLDALDLQKPEIKEGLRLTLLLFSMMNDVCTKENTRFAVVLIPTKESVFSKYIENNPTMVNLKTINAVIKNELKVNKLIKSYLKRNNIACIDVLEPMKNEIGKKAIYPPNEDGHPNKNGYEIIAKTILTQLF